MVTLTFAPEQILLLSPVHRKAVTVMRKVTQASVFADRVSRHDICLLLGT